MTDTVNRVRVDRHRGVVVATIDNQSKHNAADLGIYRGLEDALHLEAPGYVITGAGGDFSAGDDVAIFDFADEAAADDFVVEVTRIFQIIEGLPRPVVAAVDGYALGFGFELALACDVIVATPGAVCGLPEITHGAAPPNAMTRAPDVLGRGLVRHLALSGRHWLSGAQAHDFGMVCELCAAPDLVDTAAGLVIDMAGNPGFQNAKRLINLEAEAGYRLAPMIMPRLMASSAVAASQKRFAGRG
ncbi:MAG: enoyl-CoA hydratase/isomerase family protein [Acidimicrobiia bacterium]